MSEIIPASIKLQKLITDLKKIIIIQIKQVFNYFKTLILTSYDTIGAYIN